MAVLHDLEVAVVVVPAAVAGVLLGLDVVAPVDLHERHAVLDQPPAQQARLAEARPPVAVAQPFRLGPQLEHGRRARRQHAEGLVAVVVQGPRRPHLVGLTSRLVHGPQQPLAVGEAFGRQVRRQLQTGDAGAVGGVVDEAEGVVQAAQGAAALADDGLLALVQLAADDHEGRLFRARGADAGHHAAQRRARHAGQGHPVEADGPRPAAGQPEGAGHAVVVGAGLQRAQHGQPVGQAGGLREQLAEADAGDAGRDGGEGAAVLRRGVGLGVPGVELGGAAPQPQQQDRPGRPGHAGGGGAQPSQVAERQAQDRAGADLEQGAARDALAGAGAVVAEQQHGGPSGRAPSSPLPFVGEGPGVRGFRLRFAVRSQG